MDKVKKTVILSVHIECVLQLQSHIFAWNGTFPLHTHNPPHTMGGLYGGSSPNSVR
jgi:hypothetical protein